MPITWLDKIDGFDLGNPQKNVNAADMNQIKTVANATETAAAAAQANIDVHEALTNNPHSVSKAQVGLSNVDNTSDADKPISNATQTALNLKAPFANFAKRVSLTGTQNGVNNTFTIPQALVLDSEEFFRNGLLQSPPGDYTISGQTITTVTPPESGDILRINYIRP